MQVIGHLGFGVWFRGQGVMGLPRNPPMVTVGETDYVYGTRIEDNTSQ